MGCIMGRDLGCNLVCDLCGGWLTSQVKQQADRSHKPNRIRSDPAGVGLLFSTHQSMMFNVPLPQRSDELSGADRLGGLCSLAGGRLEFQTLRFVIGYQVFQFTKIHAVPSMVLLNHNTHFVRFLALGELIQEFLEPFPHFYEFRLSSRLVPSQLLIASLRKRQ